MQEHLEIVRKRFEKDNYAQSLGIVLDELTNDTIQMHMQLRENMLNWFNRPHEGEAKRVTSSDVIKNVILRS